MSTALARAGHALMPAAGPTRPALDPIIAMWLRAKHGRTGSAKTRRAYEDAIATFRAGLHHAGLELDVDAQLVAAAAEAWAGRGSPAPATFNQRLAILSSFYDYARAKRAVGENPVDLVERRPVQAYADARALDPADVRERVAAIDRGALEGQRDYALLLLVGG